MGPTYSATFIVTVAELVEEATLGKLYLSLESNMSACENVHINYCILQPLRGIINNKFSPVFICALRIISFSSQQYLIYFLFVGLCLP